MSDEFWRSHDRAEKVYLDVRSIFGNVGRRVESGAGQQVPGVDCYYTYGLHEEAEMPKNTTDESKPQEREIWLSGRAPGGSVPRTGVKIVEIRHEVRDGCFGHVVVVVPEEVG